MASMRGIRGLPDLSRFVKRGEKLPVHNTVLLLVGEESIEVSGPVISQVSVVLQELVGSQAELYLDQFVGEIEGIQDVVELLYGGVVEFSEKNYRTIMKFGLLYKVHDMYDICRKWVKKNIACLDLYKLIQFGLQLERIDVYSKDVLELCIDMIRGDGFIQASKDWVIGSFGTDVNFVKFLIQERILRQTLPLITSWLSTDGHINTVLTELEDKALVETLWKYGEQTSALFEKMSEAVTVMETCKKLNKIRDRNYRNFVANKGVGVLPDVASVPAASSTGGESKKDIVGLLSLDYCSFPLEKMCDALQQYSLNPYQVVELIFAWLHKHNWYDQYFYSLWVFVEQNKLCGRYIKLIENTLWIQSPSARIVNVANHCTYFQDELVLGYSAGNVNVAPMKFNVIKQCRGCHGHFGFNLKIVDKIPSFDLVEIEGSNHGVKHVYLACLDATGKWCIGSMYTEDEHSLEETIKWHLDAQIQNAKLYGVKLEFVYECTGKI